ncbi:hypothetical protein BO70DRAFT_262261, partial [Aspergillus heteromorphus CBS 117.55]
MCFYNRLNYACGHVKWASFEHRCNYEHRTGGQCTIRLLNMTETRATNCRLCEKIETKSRTLSAELDQLERWEREGGSEVHMKRSQALVCQLKDEIDKLERESNYRR